MHKEKRKYNPRRRVLIKLIFGLVLIVSSVAVGIQALRPTGAQIIYIAPDDNGYDALWIADVNDPEHPRQLTHHEEVFIGYFQVSEENKVIFYSIANPSTTMEFWLLNLDTNEHTNITFCITCINFELNHDGQWLTFEDYGQPSDRIYTYDLRTFEKHLVFDFGEDLTYSHAPRWVGNTQRIMFRINNDNAYDEFSFYDIEEHRIINTIMLDTSEGMPHFSHNGISYEYYPESSTRQLRDINNPDLALNLPYPVYDWHPNDEQLLMVDYFYNENNTENIFFTDIHLFNMLTGEYEILLSLENSSPQPTFNADGSQILYSAFVPSENYYQLMILDMESREEITLPIVGGRPQWVNGGQ